MLDVYRTRASRQAGFTVSETSMTALVAGILVTVMMTMITTASDSTKVISASAQRQESGQGVSDRLRSELRSASPDRAVINVCGDTLNHYIEFDQVVGFQNGRPVWGCPDVLHGNCVSTTKVMQYAAPILAAGVRTDSDTGSAIPDDEVVLDPLGNPLPPGTVPLDETYEKLEGLPAWKIRYCVIPDGPKADARLTLYRQLIDDAGAIARTEQVVTDVMRGDDPVAGLSITPAGAGWVITIGVWKNEERKAFDAFKFEVHCKN